VSSTKQPTLDDSVTYVALSPALVPEMVRLELLHVEDLGGIEAGSRACWDEDAYRFKMQECQGGGVAALESERMVGFIFHDTTEDNIVFFRKVVVGREMRRRGIGRRLAERAIADLKHRLHWPCAIRLLVLRSNQAAVHMYSNFGMKPTRVIRNYYSEGKDALLMQYMVLLDEYQKRTPLQASLSEVVTMGLYNAIGIEVAHLEEPIDPNDPLAVQAQQEREKSWHEDQERYRAMREALKSRTHVWLPDEPCSSVLLSPSDARKLIDEGARVTVEMAKKYPREYSDTDYALEGCTLCFGGAASRAAAQASGATILSVAWQANNSQDKEGVLP